VTNVHVHAVTAGYGGPSVLKDLNLSVDSGEFIAVLGSSGSGKTTLLRVLAGFLTPSQGTVSFGNHQVSGPGVWVPPEKRRVGIVPQEGALFPHLDVQRNVGFGLNKSSESDTRITEVLAMVDMTQFAQARPQELSGGQQQRVALARALAPRPDVLLLDEPFSALDAGLRATLRTEVRELLASLGTTSIMVTHDQEEALSIADRVAVMRHGQLVQMSEPSTLYQDPADIDTARFVGDSVELPATYMGGDTVHTSLGDVRIRGRMPSREGSVIAVLRPEQLVVVDPRPVGGSLAPGGLGTVHGITYHGHDSLVHVTLNSGEEISVRVPGESLVAPGENVRVIPTGPASVYAL
jgi:iron(III) transport system ATP-binding protein